MQKTRKRRPHPHLRVRRRMVDRKLLRRFARSLVRIDGPENNN